MSNQTDRLNTALAGRYRVERELGQPASELQSLRPFRTSGLD